jgi:hypothetical protein
MKKRVIAVVFGLSLMAFAGDGQPQTLTFKAQVPFPFVVGNRPCQRVPIRFSDCWDDPSKLTKSA